MTYTKGGITVWTQVLEEGKSVHKIKVRRLSLFFLFLFFCLNLHWYLSKSQYHLKVDLFKQFNTKKGHGYFRIN